jgi:hypothetical protein
MDAGLFCQLSDKLIHRFQLEWASKSTFRCLQSRGAELAQSVFVPFNSFKV